MPLPCWLCAMSKNAKLCECNLDMEHGVLAIHRCRPHRSSLAGSAGPAGPAAGASTPGCAVGGDTPANVCWYSLVLGKDFQHILDGIHFVGLGLNSTILYTSIACFLQRSRQKQTGRQILYRTIAHIITSLTSAFWSPIFRHERTVFSTPFAVEDTEGKHRR